MYEDLQNALNQFQEQEDTIKDLVRKNLVLNEKVKQYEAVINKPNPELEQAQTRLVALANKVTRLTNTLENERLKCQSLVREVSQLKGGSNPTKLKAQVQRLKDKNKAINNTNALLKKENGKYRSDNSKLADEIVKLEKHLLFAQRAVKPFGEWLLMGYPICVGANEDDPDDFNGREVGLLAMSPLGFGCILTVDNGELCYPHVFNEFMQGKAYPVPDELSEFARDWLAKVERQGHTITASDVSMFELI